MKYNSDQLADFCEVEVAIKCTRCDKVGFLSFCDQYEAADIFFEEGWRATEKHCYCPKCAEKYLKQ